MRKKRWEGIFLRTEILEMRPLCTVFRIKVSPGRAEVGQAGSGRTKKIAGRAGPDLSARLRPLF